MRNSLLKSNNKMAKLTVFGFMLMAALASTMMPVFAIDALSAVVGIVLDIVTKAGLYIGAIITVWGVFQIILAMRREDSEGISKQITTIVVGAILVGFGLTAESLLGALGVG